MLSPRSTATDMPGMCCRESSARMKRSTLSGRAGPWATPLEEMTENSQAVASAGCRSLRLDCLALQRIHQSFHQFLPLDHEVPQVVLLGAGHLALQRRQVIGQQIAEGDRLVGRKGQLHRVLTSFQYQPETMASSALRAGWTNSIQRSFLYIRIAIGDAM